MLFSPQNGLYTLAFCFCIDSLAMSLYFLTLSSMKKQDLIKAIATAAGLSQDAAAKSLKAFIDVVTKALKKGDTVGITGFGTFRVAHRKARMGVNPQNPKQKIKIAASKSPSFKSGKTFKESI
jgi:DNA-binding protein HU-beta